jgi:8-oxo-dGTP pyrophosphatase MutT (NUDIX family)
MVTELSRLVDRIVQLAPLLDPCDLEAAADQILAARMDESETASKPAASKPAASKPAASKPAASKPAASKPAASKPAAPKPAASKPAARKPGQAAEQDEAVVLICEPSQHGGTGHANTALGSAYNTQAKTQLECEQGAAREAHSAAADTLEAWLKRQPEQKVLLVGMGQFYDQYAAAGQIVKHRGIRPFAADHGALFLVSGKGPAMAIRATSTHRAGDEERRRDQDGELYTKVEFIGEYGGVLEWEQAERELRVDDQTAPVTSSSRPSAVKPVPATPVTADTSGAPLFARYDNIRRFNGTLMDETFVFEALESAGYRVERAVHKQGTHQSHGRWEVRGADFEVHPGYRDNKVPPAPLVDTIVQGTKGWKEGVLNAVAETLENAVVKALANGGDSGAANGEGKAIQGSKTRDARAAFERLQPSTPRPHQEPQARAPVTPEGQKPQARVSVTPETRKTLKAELRKVNVSKDSYVEPELRECDAQGFMAAGALLWCQTSGNGGGIHILMAEEQRAPGQPLLINFIGGKRDALGESARQTAAREVTEETGGLISEATRAAILAAGGPVLWDSQGKYTTFIVEVAPEDADLPRRLEERGGPPDPWDSTLKGVKWVELVDMLSEKWCKAAMARHHQHPLRLLWPHLRALLRRV